MIYGARRSTDVRAVTMVRVHVLTRDAFVSIQAQYPAEGALLKAEIETHLVKRGRMSEQDLIKLSKYRRDRPRKKSRTSRRTSSLAKYGDRRWSA